MQTYPLLLSTILEHAAANYPDVAVVGRYRGETIRGDYAGSALRVRKLAASLPGIGVGPQDFVGSLAWNTHRHFELFYAVAGIGAVLHTANPRLAPDQIIYSINHTGYRTLFIDADTVALAEQIAGALQTVRRFVVMAPHGSMPRTSLPDVVCYEDLVDGGDADLPWPELDENAACTLCFTSGTTGAPKGVLYSHRAIVLSVMSSGGGNGWALSADDTIIAIAGLFHCNGWGVPFFGPMYGAKLVFPGRQMDAAWLHRLIVEEGVTAAPGVPTIWLGLLEHCRATGQRLGRLQRIFTGGSAPPAAMIEAYLAEHGVRTSHGWGMTETTHSATVSFAPRHLPAAEANAAMRTQGKPLYGSAIRIVDDEGGPLPHDGAAAGHLQARGHWLAAAYFRRPDVSLTTADGWMQTGDVAVIDPGNTLHLVDRAKDVIKSGGEWISSIALEDAALSHPDVREAAVLAIPHPRWQERPLLTVTLRAGAVVTKDALRAHLGASVPKWWLPDAFAFLDEMPHGPTGKVQKDVLRRWLAEGRIEV